MTFKVFDTSKDYTPAPEGQHVGVLCDVVDCGEKEVEYEGRKSTVQKVRLVFQLAAKMEDGRRFTVSRTFSLKVGPKTALRQFLEAWRGAKYSQEDAERFRTEGLDLESLIGQNALLQVVHASANDTTYANIQTVMRLPVNMPPLAVEDYTRVIDRDDNAANGDADEDDDTDDDDNEEQGDGLPF